MSGSTASKGEKHILVVDDRKENINILFELLRKEYQIGFALNGTGALKYIKSNNPDLVLLDIMMPKMNGYDVLSCIKNDNDIRHIPVIMISAIDEMDSVVKCIESGADDYLPKPFNATLLNARIGASIAKKEFHDREQEYREQIEDYNKNLEKEVDEKVQQISSGQLAIIFSLAKISESRDPETGEHLERMREYCRALSEHLSLIPKYKEIIDDQFIKNIYAAAPLHDIGKVGVPDSILQKPGALTKEEFEIMKTHTTRGAETLRDVDAKHPGNAYIRVGIDIAEAHHEKWDGSGYPRGLSGEDIPLAGRIVALGDVYDALTSKRCYKEAYSHEKSRGIIIESSGTHFDPQVVKAFIAKEKEFVSIKDRFIDTEKVINY